MKYLVIKGIGMLFLQFLIAQFFVTHIVPFFPREIIMGMSSNVQPALIPFTRALGLGLDTFREEVLFRFAPFTVLFFVMSIVHRLEAGTFRLPVSDYSANSITWPLIIVSNVWFGYIHGNILNVFIQGLAGVVLAVIMMDWSQYLKKESPNSLAFVYVGFGTFVAWLYHFSYDINLMSFA